VSRVKKRKKKKKGLNDFFACWRTLYIWGDDAHADVDLKRNLLGYLYAIGWKGGYLFPAQDELKNPPTDGVYKSCLSEDDLYRSLKYLFHTVLKRTDKLTSHSGRKSGYLWNRIRGADAAQLMQAADHDCYEVACRYAKDCDAIKEVHAVFNDPNQGLGSFKSCYCAGEDSAVDSAAPGAQYQVPLPDLVVGFIENRVGIMPTDKRRFHPSYIMQRVTQWEKPTNPLDSLKGHLKDVSQDKTQSIINCVHSLVGETAVKAKVQVEKKIEDRAQEKFKEMIMQFTGHLSSSTTQHGNVIIDTLKTEMDKFLSGTPQLSDAVSGQIMATPTLAAVVPKRITPESRKGTLQLDSRKHFAKWSVEDKLSYIEKNFDSETGKYINSDRQWLMRVSKIYKCFTTCCNRDVAHFKGLHCRETDNFAVSSFKKCANCEN